MKHTLFILTVALLIGVSAYVLVGRLSVPADKEGVPNFTFTTVDGRNMSAHELKGRPLLINFWASWCAPCIQEMPALLEVAAQHEEQITLLGVSSDHNTEAFQNFLDKLPPLTDNVMMVHDQSGDISMGTFGIQGLPVTLVLDKNLHTVERLNGADWKKSDLNATLDSLIRN